jgi:MFS family permease
MCLLSFGSYFCYDNPAALQDNFKKDLKISTATFTAFYSWYSWPNVVLCFLGGYLIDRVLGIRFGAIFFSCLVFTGQLVFGFGALWNKIWLMDAGRFIFGIGGESLAVAQNTYAVAWFFGKELNLVFGLQLSIARLVNKKS